MTATAAFNYSFRLHSKQSTNNNSPIIHAPTVCLLLSLWAVFLWYKFINNALPSVANFISWCFFTYLLDIVSSVTFSRATSKSSLGDADAFLTLYGTVGLLNRLKERRTNLQNASHVDDMEAF